jgi:hypothetical protein
MGHSSVRTTADIYSHAIRGKDRELAEMWDKIMQPAREASKSKLRIEIERPHDPQQIISGQTFRGAQTICPER